ncbi:zinc-dependent alcohol dehydrogenase [Paradesulfitobacterium aromaticivorans]
MVKEKAGSGFALKDVDMPKPGSGEVLIKVKAVGICGSDIPIFNGVRAVPFPLIPGHEFAGEIVEVGEGVNGFKLGDRVAPSLVISCGSCDYCKLGLESMCESLTEIGIDIDGGFAEYVKAPAKVLHRLPDNVNFMEGASVDPVASAYHSVRRASINPADTVVIFGPGPIGLYALQLAKLEGAYKVIIIGAQGDESRLQIASELGADAALLFNNEEELLKKISDLTWGKMADVVIEATGVPEVFPACLKAVRKSGRLGLTGVFHRPTEVLLSQIVKKEITVRGSFCYTWLEFGTCLNLIALGKVRIDKVVSHQLPLSEIGKALEMLSTKEALKVVLEPDVR